MNKVLFRLIDEIYDMIRHRPDDYIKEITRFLTRISKDEDVINECNFLLWIINEGIKETDDLNHDREDQIKKLVDSFIYMNNADGVLFRLLIIIRNVIISNQKIMNQQEGKYSLIWDKNGSFIKQTWHELYEKINNTHGGLGIIAADFVELLTYQSAPFRESNNSRRMGFTELTLKATEEKDIKMLAKILAIMMINPFATNIEGGWFIYQLAEENDLYGFDAKRAALVINELYRINDFTAKVLVDTLRTYVLDIDDEKTQITKLLQKTGLLFETLDQIINDRSLL